MKKLLKTITILLVFLLSSAFNIQCWFSSLQDDLKTGSTEFKSFIKDNDEAFSSYEILYTQASTLKTNVEELKLVSKNLDEINKAGGYLKWKIAVNASGTISNSLRSKIFSKLSTSQGNNLISELSSNSSLKFSMENDEILTEIWKRINEGIPNFKIEKPIDYLTCMKKMSKYEKMKGGSGTVKYYRVQGGGTGSATSRELLEVSSKGELTFTDKTKELYFSTDDLDHANYYITGKGTNINGEVLSVTPPRSGGKIIEFEVPKWLDDKLKAEVIPQYKAGSNSLNKNSPQIVDYNQPGNPLGIKLDWQTLIEKNYIIGSAKIIK